MLTANRDGFTSAVREQFSKVVGELVQNQSAMRYGQALDLSINFDGGSDVAKRVHGGQLAGVEPGVVAAAMPLIMVCPEVAKPESVAG